MELTHVEKQRTELLQFVLLVMSLFLAIITYLAVRQGQVPILLLTVLSLCACLYVIIKERRLKGLQAQLLQELIEKERQVVDERGKSASLESRLKELTGLYRAISAVNSAIEPEHTFDSVLRAALELVRGNCGSLMLLDETGDGLVIVTSQGLSDQVVAQTRRRMGEGIVGWVARNCEPVLLTGKVGEDERFRGVIEREKDLHFSISVPLQLRNQVMGVLNLGVTPDESREEFSDYDLRMATIFAQHASVAIENARLMKTMA